MIQVASSETWGDLPADWDLVKMAHAVRIPNGLVDPTDERYAGLRLIAPNHVESHTARLTAWESAENQGASSGKYLVQQGDLVYSKIRPKLNKVAVAPERCLCSADMYPIRPRHELFVSSYLLYVMLSTPFWKRTVDESMRVAMPKVNRDSLGAIRVPVPPLAVQRAIASFLDRETARIDTLIEKKRRLLDLLEEKRTAVITRAGTRGLDPDVPMKDSGLEWIGEIPEHWEVAPLKFAAAKIVDCLHSTPSYEEDGDYPAVRTSDVDSGRLHIEGMRLVGEDEYRQRTRRLLPRAEDIVYSREGERYGHAALIPPGERLCLAQRMMHFRAASTYVPAYLMWALNSRGTYAQASLDTIGATSPHVNVETIRNFQIPRPTIEEQRAIAAHLDTETARIADIRRHIGTAIELLQEYRTALISAAVTGKIDVTEPALAPA